MEHPSRRRAHRHGSRSRNRRHLPPSRRRRRGSQKRALHRSSAAILAIHLSETIQVRSHLHDAPRPSDQHRSRRGYSKSGGESSGHRPSLLGLDPLRTTRTSSIQRQASDRRSAANEREKTPGNNRRTLRLGLRIRSSNRDDPRGKAPRSEEWEPTLLSDY